MAAIGLLQASDPAIWKYAKVNNFVIVSTDSDFFELVTTLGPPPKVIWLRNWSHPTKDAEMLLRNKAIRITEFERDPVKGILILDKS